jgi:hypothetical protein
MPEAPTRESDMEQPMHQSARALGLVAALTFLMGSAFVHAQSSPPESERSIVKDEARQAEESGTLPRGEAEPAKVPTTKSDLSRSAVRAQARTIREPMVKREFGTEAAHRPKDTKSRAQVKAEAREAEHDDEIPRGEATHQ